MKTIRCSTCGQINRVDADKLQRGLQPKCGKCNSPLIMFDGPVNVSDTTFEETVINAALPVLVDFWAPWCGPCHALAPTIEELASEFSRQIRVAKLNTDENPNTAARFAIRGIPTLIFFLNGREVDRMVGVAPKQTIAARIQAAIEQQRRAG